MEQYYYTDGKERYGPFTLDQLRDRKISQETLIWKEGLPDWMAAKNMSDLNSLFQAVENFHAPIPPPFAYQVQEFPPKNWLVESILVTIFCCLPFGIVGIINATKVETLWNSGQKEAAIRASQEAGKWTKIGFIICVVVVGLYFIMMIFGLITAIGLGNGISQ
jgi:hypothetical protein